MPVHPVARGRAMGHTRRRRGRKPGTGDHRHAAGGLQRRDVRPERRVHQPHDRPAVPPHDHGHGQVRRHGPDHQEHVRLLRKRDDEHDRPQRAHARVRQDRPHHHRRHDHERHHPLLRHRAARAPLVRIRDVLIVPVGLLRFQREGPRSSIRVQGGHRDSQAHRPGHGLRGHGHHARRVPPALLRKRRRSRRRDILRAHQRDEAPEVRPPTPTSTATSTTAPSSTP